MKILVAVGNQILSEGLKNLLTEHLPDCMLVDSFCPQVMIDPDLVLFDSEAEVGTLINHYPDAKFICLDLGLSDCEVAYLVFCHRINGIIPPRVDIHMFCKALHLVNQGELWIGQDYLKKAMQHKSAMPECQHYRALSEQDKKIIDLLVLGRKNIEIADELCLSESTIKAHVSRIYKTLKVKNRAQMATLASMNHWSADPSHLSDL